MEACEKTRDTARLIDSDGCMVLLKLFQLVNRIDNTQENMAMVARLIPRFMCDPDTEHLTSVTKDIACKVFELCYEQGELRLFENIMKYIYHEPSTTGGGNDLPTVRDQQGVCDEHISDGVQNMVYNTTLMGQDSGINNIVDILGCTGKCHTVKPDHADDDFQVTIPIHQVKQLSSVNTWMASQPCTPPCTPSSCSFGVDNIQGYFSTSHEDVKYFHDVNLIDQVDQLVQSPILRTTTGSPIATSSSYNLSSSTPTPILPSLRTWSTGNRRKNDNYHDTDAYDDDFDFLQYIDSQTRCV